MKHEPNKINIGSIVRKMEDDYTRGNVTISEYVSFDMYKTINKIEAYLNSKHISGEKDSLGRDKPFFNISVASANIWQRATDIDRKNIKVKATKSKDTIDAFLATVHLQNWMTKAQFGQYLNEWGRVLARYGSAVTKVVEKKNDLYITVVPWNRLIVDQIDFDNNVKVEVLELTEAQLRQSEFYDKDQVEALCNAKRSRETLRKQRKDDKNDYIKLYEVHGVLPLSTYKISKGEEPVEKDYSTYVQQMYVISYLASKENKGEYDDFILYSGLEEKDPYTITHLIKEDGRTLSIGAVEHLFEAQWMVNHTAKALKDQLDMASKLLFQTSDPSFVGQNALSAIENGDILIHAQNQPLTQLNNSSHDTTALQNFHTMWKSLGNEITGISEAMLGVMPKSGTAWRQTEALLQESYSLFELMTENKSLGLEYLLREYVLPHVKKQMDTSEEVSATLELYDIESIDSKFIKNYAIKESNNVITEKILNDEEVTPQMQTQMIDEMSQGIKSAMGELGTQRFFKPSEISSKTWKEQFKNLEWELEVDITGENKDYQSALATLNTALQVAVQPGFEQNKRAQIVVDKILLATGHLSPLELGSIRSSPAPVAPIQGGSPSGVSISNLIPKT